MRILHWTDHYPPFRGGTETVVQRLATAMAAAGHAVAVVTGTHPQRPDRTGEDGVTVHRFPFADLLTGHDAPAVLRTIRAIAALKRDFAPDIVHLHLSRASGFFHLRTRQAAPVPTLLTIHAPLDALQGGERGLLGELIGSADWLTGVSAAMVADAVRIAPGAATASSVVHNGDAMAVRDDPPDDPPYLFASGRHVAAKGLDVAIAAMPAVLRRVPDARLVLASDGPLRAQLEAQARDLGIAEAVRFTGWLDDGQMRDLAARSLAVLVPSRWQEGFGLVALEAALLSRPVIATARGGLPEVVLHRQTGIILDALAPGALAAAAVALLEDRALARRLGRQAAARAVRLFGLDRQVAAFVGLYRRLAEAPR